MIRPNLLIVKLVFNYHSWYFVSMLSFTILLMPLAMGFCLSIDGKKNNIKNIYVASVFGIIAGIVYSFIDVLISSNYYLAKYSFWSNWFHFGLIEMLLPALIITGLYVLCTKTYFEMFKSLFYVLIGFFSVYMSVRIISQHARYHYFLVFFKPILFLTALLYLRELIFKIYSKIELNGKSLKVILPIVLCMVLLLLVPAAIETTWLIGLPEWIWYISTVLYIAGYFVLWYLPKKIKI